MKYFHRLLLESVATAVGGTLLAVMAVAQGVATKDKDSSVESAPHTQTGNTQRRSESPAAFVKQASEDGEAEVQLGKLAEKKAVSDEVRSFAQMMVRDHTKANAELKSIAAGKKLTVATEPSSEQRKTMEQLSAKSGKEFDAAYINHMAEDHHRAVALFQQAAQSDDADLARFASKTLPTLQNHKQMADSLRNQHGSKTGSVSGTGNAGSES